MNHPQNFSYLRNLFWVRVGERCVGILRTGSKQSFPSNLTVLLLISLGDFTLPPSAILAKGCLCLRSFTKGTLLCSWVIDSKGTMLLWLIWCHVAGISESLVQRFPPTITVSLCAPVFLFVNPSIRLLVCSIVLNKVSKCEVWSSQDHSCSLYCIHRHGRVNST